MLPTVLLDVATEAAIEGEVEADHTRTLVLGIALGLLLLVSRPPA